MKKFLAILFGSLAGVFLFVTPASALDTVIYDSLPETFTNDEYGNNYYATLTNEFGDYVHLGGEERVLSKITVGMSSWASYSEYQDHPTYSLDTQYWTHPVTIKIYKENPLSDVVTDADLIVSHTQNIQIPWRPETTEACGYDAWMDTNGNCHQGISFNSVFDLVSYTRFLPNDIYVTLSFTTQTTGEQDDYFGPYNALSVLIPPSQNVTEGLDNDVNGVYWNTMFMNDSSLQYFDGYAGLGTMAMKIEAVVWADQCKNDGWMNPYFDFDRSINVIFRNQGDCVSYFHSNENAVANKEK
jgi:hypothetical protein